jgi:hypothetical protein
MPRRASALGAAHNGIPPTTVVSEHHTDLMTNRPNRLLAAAVAAIAVLAVIATVVSATRSAPELDPATPEGVVQAYVAALLDGDSERAAAHFAPGTGCDAADLDPVVLDTPARVVLLDTRTTGDTARVEVRIVHSPGDFPGSGEYGEDHTFRLGRVGGRWLLTGAPWPVYDCAGGPR